MTMVRDRDNDSPVSTPGVYRRVAHGWTRHERVSIAMRNRR